MIVLRCTSCGQSLEIDDAFAGGVCRCRFCGTIQTVPADARRAEAGAPVGAAAGSGRSRPLYRRGEEDADVSTSGLEDLADVIASSGPLSSGLQRHGRKARKHKTAAPAAESSTDPRLMAAVGAAAVLALVTAALVVALVTRSTEPTASASEARVAAEAPTFAGLPLGHRVVFVVDRGTQTQPSFAAVNEAILGTLRRMRPSTQFQVVYWSNPTLANLPERAVVALPGRSLRDASEQNLQTVEQGMAEVITGGTTDIGPALELALRNRPDTIILVTGKAWQLSDSFSDSVLTAIQERQCDAVVHTVAVGDTNDGLGEPMRRIARARGGRFTGLTTNALRELQSTY